MRLRLSFVALLASLAALASAGSAAASATKCTSAAYTTQQCIVVTGSGLNVSDIRGQIKTAGALQGTFQMRLRVGYPDGTLRYFWGPDQKTFNCQGDPTAYKLCWDDDWGSPKGKYGGDANGNYPNKTDLCMATYRVALDGTRSFERGWACANVHI